MVDKNKVCIMLMGIMIFQTAYIMKNSKKEDIVIEKNEKDISLIYEDLNGKEEIRILGIKETNSGAIGKIEFEGDKNQIIEILSKLKKYGIKNYSIKFNEGILKVNAEVK